MEARNRRRILAGATVAGAALVVAMAAATWAGSPNVLIIEPTTAHNTEPVTIAIAGTELTDDDLLHADVRLVRDGRPDIVATGLVATPPVILATFDIVNESPGTWGLQVTSDQGTSSCGNCFTITADPPATPQPHPVGLAKGTTGVEVTVRGARFFPGATVTFSHPGIAVRSLEHIDTTELRVTVDVAADTAWGTSDITVTNTDGQAASCAGCFTVISTPTVETISPASRGQGATGQIVSIVGTDIAPAASVAFSGGGISIGSTTVLGPSEVRATISVAASAAVGARTVTITNPDGGSASCSACFVVTPAPTPTIASPKSLGQGASARTITISGSGFQAGATADLGAGITVDALTRDDDTQLTATITVAPDAAPGSRVLRITNPDAGSSTCAACFSISAAPQVGTLTPDARGAGATDQAISISGSGFAPGATVSFSGTGVSVLDITFIGPEELTATIDIAGDATPGGRSVTVTNPDHGSGACIACFTIHPAPTLTGVSPATAPRGGIGELLLSGTGFSSAATVAFSSPDIAIGDVTIHDGATASVSITVGTGAALGSVDVSLENGDGSPSARCEACLTITEGMRLDSVEPASRGQGALDAVLVLHGKGFDDDVTVAFSGSGITIAGVTSVEPDRITMEIDVADDASPGPRTVTLSHPSSIPVECSSCFTVNAAPAATSVSPAALKPGASNREVLVSGSSFQPGATVTFSGTGIHVTSTTFEDAGRITATIDVAPDATEGARDVTVTNPDGGTPSTCDGCFTVTSAPVVTAVDPSSRGRGATGQTLTITGSAFDEGASVAFSGTGVIVTAVTLVSPEELRVTVDIDADAPVGARTVVVSHPDGSPDAACDGCFGVNAAPTLSAANPPVVGQGTSGRTIRLGGSGFQPGASVAVSGSGITLQKISVVSGNRIDVTLDVAATARTGARTFTVTNPDGAPPATCARCLTISAVARTVDFNGDGYADLVIGAPGDTVAGRRGAGSITVVYGRNGTLRARGNQRWNLSVSGVRGNPRVGDGFGTSFATGDFDGDGYTDLAIGVPGRTIGGRARAGAVYILYGSPSGLGATRTQVWHMNVRGVPGSAKRNARFGAALTAGDFDGDGYADLAIGAPGETIAGRRGAGSVTVLHGSASGLATVRRSRWHANQKAVRGSAQQGAGFGSALATGDVDADGSSDLAIGIPGQRIDGRRAAGAALVVYGSRSGPSRARTQLWHRGLPGMRGGLRPNAGFGTALAMGDLNGDGFMDLAIGAPGDVVNRQRAAGSITVLLGSKDRFTVNRSQTWRRHMPGVPGIARAGDGFGSALTIGDFDGDGFADLAIGVPGHRLGTRNGAGAVNVVYGARSKLWRYGQVLHRGMTNMAGPARAGDRFGAALTALDLNGDGRADLAIGGPGATVKGVRNAGSVTVVYGSGQRLRPRGSQLWHRGRPALIGRPLRDAAFGSTLG